jgi:hypothetical protein
LHSNGALRLALLVLGRINAREGFDMYIFTRLSIARRLAGKETATTLADMELLELDGVLLIHVQIHSY